MSSSSTSARPPTPGAPTARTGLAILCFRHFDDVVRRIGLRVAAQDVEDQAMVVMLGDQVGVRRDLDRRVQVWLNVIVRRRIADFHRDARTTPRSARCRPSTRARRRSGARSRRRRRDRRACVVQSVIDECLEELSEAHRDVIELNVFQDLDATETADASTSIHPTSTRR